MKFDLPKELASIIKVIGVGGGGSNAVNHMYEQGIKGVDFIICNTDRQALDVSPVPVKLQLGMALTEGLGAGSIPERGNQAAQENLDEIRQLLGVRTKMVFITAGMGGGTGTGAGPVIAGIARELGILTVGIVTMPFQWEGKKRKLQAAAGIEELRKAVDTLLVINNDRLRDLFGNLSLDNAFEHADNVLTTAARGIAEIITKTGKVNVDFEDVKTVMTSSGVAIMGMAEAEGEDRSLRAAQEALASPLLNDNDIKGAKYVLLNITHGTREVLMDEISEITDHIQDAAGSSADVIWGYGKDETLGDKVRITVIATGFATHPDTGVIASERNVRTVIPLDADRPTMITQPIVNPVMASAPAAPAPPP
ncbi:MAG TPA: cell division protein FtsZ, partial [Flavobacteriales bacterium]|nr:cell division protein FtsZ [Flavobacteriales bacterium]